MKNLLSLLLVLTAVNLSAQTSLDRLANTHETANAQPPASFAPESQLKQYRLRYRLHIPY